MSIVAPEAAPEKVSARTPRTSPPHRRWRSHTLPVSVALAAPAVRLVVVEAWAGIVPVSFALGQCSNVAYRVVPAPWPPEVDRERLASVIHVVGEEAETKAVTWGGGLAR